jgi:hypothetical protein
MDGKKYKERKVKDAKAITRISKNFIFNFLVLVVE